MLNQYKKIDWSLSLLITTIILSIGLSTYVLYSPIETSKFLSEIYWNLSKIFESTFQYGALTIVCTLILLALLPFGNIKVDLGNRPVHSFISWSAMIFAAGMGATLLYWSSIEWAYYLNDPPKTAITESLKMDYARSYSIFHWGITGWAIYTLPAIAFALAVTLDKDTSFRFSSILYKRNKTNLDKLIRFALDLIFILAVLSGAGTSLGLSFPMISAGVVSALGINPSDIIDYVVLLFCFAVFGSSVYLGISKGIKVLSNINLILVILFVLFIFVVGPTTYIIENSLETIHFTVKNFIQMSVATDDQFVQSWTIFYWAWWLALAPFVGSFIANISNGRTLREMIMGSLIIGTIICSLYFLILGNYSIYQSEFNGLDIPYLINAEGTDPASVVIQVINTLPYGSFTVGVFSIIAIIFLCTTYDSAAYVLSSSTMNKGSDEPIKSLRLVYALILIVQPALLMYMGGVDSVKWMLVIVSIPLIFVNMMLIYSIIKNVRKITKS